MSPALGRYVHVLNVMNKFSQDYNFHQPVMYIFLLQVKIVPRAQHVFRVEQGCATSPLGITNINDLIVFASSVGKQGRHPKWCGITNTGKIHKIVVVLVSCVGVKEYMENQSAFSQCNKLFEQVR